MLDQKMAGKVHRVHLEVHRTGDSTVKYAKCNRDPSFAFDYYVEVAIEWIVIVICIRLEFLHVKEMVIYLFYYLGCFFYMVFFVVVSNCCFLFLYIESYIFLTKY